MNGGRERGRRRGRGTRRRKKREERRRKIMLAYISVVECLLSMRKEILWV